MGAILPRQLEADGQGRVWWANTPVDVVLDTTPFHVDVAERIHREPFAGIIVHYLGPDDPRLARLPALG